MPTFGGFPRGTRYTPVPNLLLSDLLEQIDDLGELKCVLRVLALAYRRKGFPQTVPEEEALADGVLSKALGGRQAVRRGLARAVERGVLLRGTVGGAVVLALHTEAHRGALGEAAEEQATIRGEGEGPPQAQLNIFALYEQNIGALTPIMAEVLKDAEQTYPEEWVQDAFREAVTRNKRSWHYIESILKRWAVEGREHGESGRHPEKITATEYIRRYGLRR